MAVFGGKTDLGNTAGSVRRQTNWGVWPPALMHNDVQSKLPRVARAPCPLTGQYANQRYLTKLRIELKPNELASPSTSLVAEKKCGSETSAPDF